jgi:hypothetical protein
VQGADPAAQPGRQHVLELRKRERARLLDAPNRGHRLQADRDRDCLLVVEQQGREPAVLAEPVTALRPPDRVDRVVECLESFDVLADGPLAHVEPGGQVRSRPRAGRLEQPEQGQQTARSFEHKPSEYRNEPCRYWI